MMRLAPRVEPRFGVMDKGLTQHVAGPQRRRQDAKRISAALS
jgi:hypothetical protein